jgi:serine/threonine-protein kinase
MTAVADRHLLFGLLALPNGIISQGQLLAAFQAWTLDKAKSLADHLEARGDLTSARRAVLEALASVHLDAHGGDVERSLAAVSVWKSAREGLARIGGPEINATLDRIGSAHSSTEDGDPDRTTSYSVGSAISDGQRFQILRAHARGGLGAVFVARDTELNREVALKQILDHHADDQGSRARFVLEAEITGGLEHPGIVPVYGLGTYPDGRPYYAMRFIRGESFKEAIAAFHADVALKRDPGRRSLALRKLLRRFLDLCNAIDYAHSRGVLHRDIKPANVILGKYGETLVVDWGLAKAVGRIDPVAESEERMLVPSLSSGSAETLPGSALGTPAYMSPEQAAGDLERLGPRSDVYCLGATLYCLLTSKPPVENDDMGTALRGVQKCAIRPPRQLDPAIDPALEAVCLKAMALRSEHRYPTARALAEDIDRWMADEPVTARKEPLAESLRRWMRRRRTAVTAGGAALAAGVLGLAAVLAVQARANVVLKAKNGELIAANTLVTHANAELLAANERERARFNLALDAVKLFHGEVSADLLFKEKQFEGLRNKLLRGAADFYSELEGLLKGQTDRQSRAALGNAYAELAGLTDQIGSQPEAIALHRKALAVRRELAEEPRADALIKADVVRSLIEIGRLQRDTGHAAAALESLHEAGRLAEGLAAAVSSGDPLQAIVATAYHQMGATLDDYGTTAERMAFRERALAIRQKLADAHPNSAEFQRDLALSQYEMAQYLASVGKLADAVASNRRALAIRRKLAEANPDDTRLQRELAFSHMHTGYLLQLMGKRTEALAAFERELAIRQKLAEVNPNVTELQSSLARSHGLVSWVLRSSGKTAEAQAALDRAIGIYRKLADSHPTVVESERRLALNLGEAGGMLQAAGRHAEAASANREAVAILERRTNLGPLDRYNLACGHAQLAGLAAQPGSGVTAAEGRAVAERSMHCLRQAVAGGYRNVALMRRDTSLAPLRSRPDFQLMMMDLEFPDDAFAR